MPEALVHYLEMRTPPLGTPLSAPSDLAKVLRTSLTVEEYLSLYKEVGGRVGWDSRLKMSVLDLHKLLASDLTSIFILYYDGRRSGLCEFDMYKAHDVQLTNYGIIPELEGKGLARYLLDYALRQMWQKQPDRIWLHTDSWDSVKALPTYLRAGFHILDKRYEVIFYRVSL
jgi:ribosomal protein S18 acetylase RimI-like enzyme